MSVLTQAQPQSIDLPHFNLVSQLRERLEDLRVKHEVLKEDFYLLQWLKCQKLKVDDAEKAIRASFSWREENGLTKLGEQELRPVSEYGLVWRDIIDHRTGVSVTYHPVGLWDVRGFVGQFGRKAFVDFQTHLFLRGEHLMVEFNRGLKAQNPRAKSLDFKGVTMVMDGSGYSIAQARSIQTTLAALDCARIYANYFPKPVEAVYVINVSKVLGPILKLIKPFLSVVTFEVFDNSESDKERWSAKLRTEFGMEKLSV